MAVCGLEEDVQDSKRAGRAAASTVTQRCALVSPRTIRIRPYKVPARVKIQPPRIPAHVVARVTNQPNPHLSFLRHTSLGRAEACGPHTAGERIDHRGCRHDYRLAALRSALPALNVGLREAAMVTASPPARASAMVWKTAPTAEAASDFESDVPAADVRGELQAVH